jgi:serine protease Do
MKKFNIKSVLFSVILVLILSTTVFTSCAVLNGNTTATTAAAEVTTTAPISTDVNSINPTWDPISLNDKATGQITSIADVVEMVKPAVVAITTEVTGYDWFNRAYTQEGAGSGWIIDPNGIIVTNNHVVEGAKTITVTTDSGVSYTADPKSVYTDPLNDLAIIKIDATGLPALKTGNASSLRLGDWVIAIGNALGQGTRVTEGIVSRKDVSLSVDQSETLYNLIETSAAINPGNSGGPLLNLNGEVVGITSAKIATVGVEGMGYAISIDTAMPIIKELVNKGYVTRPYLGVNLYNVSDLSNGEKTQFNIKVDAGILLYQIAAGSPAADAGLKAGDVVVSIGGRDVTTIKEFTTVLYASPIGKPLEIKYWRGDTETTTTVTPIETPRSS